MKIKGKTKDWEVIYCKNFLSRLKGNMGKKEIDNVLQFPKCNSIHTFFMRSAIDVVMISESGIVLHCFPKVSKWRIIWPRKNVYAILEFPPGENQYHIGDQIEYKK